MNSVFSIRQRRVLIVSITLLFGAFLLYALKGLFSAFLGASVMYVLFRPALIFLHVKKRWPRWLCAWVIMLISFLILVLPFVVVGLMIAEKVTEFLENKEAITSIFQNLEKFIGVNFNDLELIDKGFKFLEENLAGGLGNILSSTAGLLLTISMMYFLLYFMIYSFKSFEAGILKYMPFGNDQSDLFALELRNSTFSNVLGQGFIALVQGALVALGFYLFNYPDALFWGTVSFFLSFLPVIGAPIVFVPAALIALAHGDSQDGYGLLLWGFLLVTNIDNVLRYFISKYVANTHPIIAIVGVIIGIPVFGILGLVFGPLLISWFLLMLRVIEESNKQELINGDAG
jgi:predicted PurR-regulated permease PerM